MRPGGSGLGDVARDGAGRRRLWRCQFGPRSPGPGATVFHEERVGPRIVDLNIRSPALGATVKVRLLTPDGWTAARTSRRWPVLYLLHGCCDSYESWTRSTDIEELPQLRKVLVVMPEAGPVGFYSNWHGTDGEPGPAWETFHLTEVRQALEREYGAGSRRAVDGLSMGGLGAMGYAARHPGLFRAAASFSGLLDPLQDVEMLLGLFSAYTPNPRAIWGDPAGSVSSSAHFRHRSGRSPLPSRNRWVSPGLDLDLELAR